MKKAYLIISILIFSFLPKQTEAQDIIGGQINVWYDNLGTPYPMVMMLKLKLYTKASQNVNRPSVNVYSSIGGNIYTTLPKVSDTIIGNDIRLSIYEKSTNQYVSNINTYTFIDSISGKGYKNINTTQKVPFVLRTNIYVGDISLILQKNTAVCTDNLNQLTNNNGLLNYPLLCTTNYTNDDIDYEIEEQLLEVDTSIYFNPISNTQFIDSTGLFNWQAPLEAGNYLFRVNIINDGGQMERLITLSVTDELLTNSLDLEENNHLQVFPNPTTNYLTIKFDYFTPKDTEIEIFDMVGRRVHTQIMQQQNEQINLSHFANGVYVVRVRSGEQTWTRKVVKQ